MKYSFFDSFWRLSVLNLNDNTIFIIEIATHMTRTIYLFVGTLFLCFPLFAKSTGADTLNRIDKLGRRYGYWIVDNQNEPIAMNATTKWKEGTYVKGRKEGVWINYFEDGKTPRLIGEYADNRPAGAFFRFNNKGALQQASSVPRKVRYAQSIAASNDVFTCKMNFENKEVVAGQVYFSQKIIKKNAFQFWVEKSLEAISSESKVIDFTWMNTNYDKLYAKYLEVRTPNNQLKETAKIEKEVLKIEATISKEQESARKGKYFLPPLVRNPRVASGLKFQSNGFNKLYTVDNEIWIDGYFKNGQLQDGKVFIYDTDGVLLKVRVYKNGMYESDGIL